MTAGVMTNAKIVYAHEQLFILCYWSHCSLQIDKIFVAVQPIMFFIFCGVKCNEPQHEKTYLRICVPSEDTDQPAHLLL